MFTYFSETFTVSSRSGTNSDLDLPPPYEPRISEDDVQQREGVSSAALPPTAVFIISRGEVNLAIPGVIQHNTVPAPPKYDMTAALVDPPMYSENDPIKPPKYEDALQNPLEITSEVNTTSTQFQNRNLTGLTTSVVGSEDQGDGRTNQASGLTAVGSGEQGDANTSQASGLTTLGSGEQINASTSQDSGLTITVVGSGEQGDASTCQDSANSQCNVHGFSNETTSQGNNDGDIVVHTAQDI